MTLTHLFAALVSSAPLLYAAPAWAQSQGITPRVGGSGATVSPHASGFQTGPGLQPPMAAPGPKATERLKTAEQPARPAGEPPPAPAPAPGPVNRPARNGGATSAAPISTRGQIPEIPGPHGINPHARP